MTISIYQCQCSTSCTKYFFSSQCEHFSISDVPEMLMALATLYYNQGEARDPDGSEERVSWESGGEAWEKGMADDYKIGGTSSD
jgi:hypothetical protein